MTRTDRIVAVVLFLVLAFAGFAIQRQANADSREITNRIATYQHGACLRGHDFYKLEIDSGRKVARKSTSPELRRFYTKVRVPALERFFEAVKDCNKVAPLP